MARKKLPHYEYEMCVAHIDARAKALITCNINLSRNSAFAFRGGLGLCGLNICSIRAKNTVPIGPAVITLA
ncbi:MAG: hypothetical protein AB1665_02985 [Candidatus Thermoplasmatota archaeon]